MQPDRLAAIPHSPGLLGSVVAEPIALALDYPVVLAVVATPAGARLFSPPRRPAGLATLVQWLVVVVRDRRPPEILPVWAIQAPLLVPPFLVLAAKVAARMRLRLVPTPVMAVGLVLET